MPGEKVYPGSGGSGTSELPPPPKDFYNISIKDQIYGSSTAPAAAAPRKAKSTRKRRSCKPRNPCHMGGCTPCRCCCSWLFTLLVLIIVGGVVFYVVVRPKIPDYEVTDFRLTGLDSSLATQQLVTESSMTIRTHNGNNKMSFDYKSIKIHVETKKGQISVGDGTIPGFSQKTGETVNVTGNLKATPMALGKANTDILLKGQKDGNLPLKVKVDMKTRLQLASAKFIKLKIKVRCDIAINPKVATGSQILSKNCDYSGRPYF